MKINTIEALKVALKEQGISQAAFLRQYYLEEVDPNPSIDADSLGLHLERFKKITDSAPERIIPYGNYFIQKYRKDGIYTQADRTAAWEMWVELDTRITTLPLNEKDGVDQSALTSIYQLFQIHRELSKRHGPNCKGYYQLAKGYFEHDIRPFTAKWHKQLDEKSGTNFRGELLQLQDKLNEFKNRLEEIHT